MTNAIKPVFLDRVELPKGYFRLHWKVPYLQDQHAFLVLSRQWKFDLHAGMSPELTWHGDYSFSWESNDKELEANMLHMKKAVEQSIPLYEERMRELQERQDEMKKQEEEKQRQEEEFKKKIEKLLE